MLGVLSGNEQIEELKSTVEKTSKMSRII